MESVDTRTVAYRGARTGTAPMTWGQRAIWKSIRWLDEGAHYFNIRRIAQLPYGTSQLQVDAAIAALLERHEALRTTFHEGAEGWRQHLTDTGTLRYPVVDAAPAPPRTPPPGSPTSWSPGRSGTPRRSRSAAPWCATAAAPPTWCWSSPTSAWTSGRCANWSATCGSCSPGSRAPPRLAAARPGRVRERGGGRPTRRRRRRALAAHPGEDPARAVPAGRRPGAPERFVRLGMDSPAAAVAATAIAERCQVSTGTVLLAATAAVLGAWTGHPLVPLQLIAVNRHDDRTRRLVAAMAENALFSLDVGTGTFDQAVKRAFLAGMNAYRHAHYDPIAVDEVLDAARERNGGVLQLGHFFNDKRMHDRWEDLPDVPATPEDLAPLTAKTRIFHVGSWERQDALFFVHTTYAPDTALLYLMADTALIPRQDIERVLRAFEGLLVAAAAEPVELAAVAFDFDR
ncbi:hypothetical protein [Kitasatospora fiedleri]|uniref:hypothetical protein n=1 Tax=Kitasatospora fiedleri TaxID=2991545 RepID=UPI00249BDEB1|nr:hypothetical protein [Kitasatospora fiedleri]